jgi:hypothetical protein
LNLFAWNSNESKALITLIPVIASRVCLLTESLSFCCCLIFGIIRKEEAIATVTMIKITQIVITTNCHGVLSLVPPAEAVDCTGNSHIVNNPPIAEPGAVIISTISCPMMFCK